MAGRVKIKLFTIIQKLYQIIGVTNKNGIRTYFFLFCFAQFSFSSAAHLLFEASSLTEYGLVFYVSITTAIYALFWQMENTVDYIDNVEKFIQKSERFFNNSTTSQTHSPKKSF